MKGLVTKMAATKVSVGAIRRRICEECRKTGHDKSFCFKLKICFRCGAKGHISRFGSKKNTRVVK